MEKRSPRGLTPGIRTEIEELFDGERWRGILGVVLDQLGQVHRSGGFPDETNELHHVPLLFLGGKGVKWCDGSLPLIFVYIVNHAHAEDVTFWTANQHLRCSNVCAPPSRALCFGSTALCVSFKDVEKLYISYWNYLPPWISHTTRTRTRTMKDIRMKY